MMQAWSVKGGQCKVEQVTIAELGRSAKESRGTAQAWRYWVQDYYEVQGYKEVIRS